MKDLTFSIKTLEGGRQIATLEEFNLQSCAMPAGLIPAWIENMQAQYAGAEPEKFYTATYNPDLESAPEESKPAPHPLYGGPIPEKWTPESAPEESQDTPKDSQEYPESMRELIDLFGEPIHTYTREEAIEDGFLIDLNQWIPIDESGYPFPIACTPEVWKPIETTVKGTHRDYAGVVWDIFHMSRYCKKDISDTERLFKVRIGRAYQYLTLELSGDGPNGETVGTIKQTAR